jgi:hypothetical protein
MDRGDIQKFYTRVDYYFKSKGWENKVVKNASNYQGFRS